ncbi:hypothetical protein I7I51_05276 [Histoplasma capsulatum]|uniref:Uncharacterized protein n=1 Tax=Ajellomyces capsulatus TaxID=5037 RepID=A0A8A1M1X2_AJECA|nr:predicted protein [Histoplasma mississippiense (nom. inval.)]EDN03847.1 predicted protein [Histoplasma mississippiense (nom. inval.)]QSS60476.1 hypothetical protein I7I51_05276 [Histoplasma capsulatum]
MSSSPQLPEDWIGPTENDGWDARQHVGVCAFSKNVNCYLQDAVRSLSPCAVEDWPPELAFDYPEEHDPFIKLAQTDTVSLALRSVPRCPTSMKISHDLLDAPEELHENTPKKGVQ